MNRFFYIFVVSFIQPFIVARLLLRSIKTPIYRKRIFERYAMQPPLAHASTVKKPIWIHAVSVGEVGAASGLVNELLRFNPHQQIIITTTTPTGSDHVNLLFGERVIHFYAPYDTYGAITRFLKKFEPSILLLMETELWPNMIHICAKKGVKVAIVNGRLSDRSYEKYKKWNWVVEPMLKDIDLFITQNESDANNFISLSADVDKIHVIGNLKFDVNQLYSNKKILSGLSGLKNTRQPVLIAASTREGEEEKVLNAFSFVLEKMPSVVLIIVPRHPERFEDVARLVSDLGFEFSRRSEDKELADPIQVYLGDTMGELMAYYRSADVAFVGGSLVDTGCQNVIEPASLGLPVLVGPSQYNFSDICSELESASALRTVNNSEELGLAFLELLSDASVCAEMGENGKAFVRKRSDVVSSTLKTLNIIYEVF